MTTMRLLGRRSKPGQCARALSCALAATVAAVLGFAAAASGGGPVTTDEPGSIVAAFGERSYAPGQGARLSLWTPAARLRARFFRAGPEQTESHRDDVLGGVPAGPETALADARTQWLHLPRGASGLYFLQLEAPGGRRGYAPFVLRPAHLGTARVAVVLPTNTWQAYNFRGGATWYFDPHYNGVDLTRPFLNRGVPPHFRGYDRGFLLWLAHTGRHPDFLADDDLERVSGDELARDYDLIVFSGHDEYATPHVWDAIARYRDLGGNLAFLSANDFFYRVVRRGNRIYRTGHWYDFGRSDASLIGAGYVGWFKNLYPNRPYTVSGAHLAPWLFRGTDLRNGDTFGNYGIEIDQRTTGSPPGTEVLARIPNQFGPGRSAEMTYYTTPRGAKVFSAGVINFGGSAEQPVVSRLLANLWRHLRRP
jgi:N,N-dimethylformamidase beta subunit-like, C-terminal